GLSLIAGRSRFGDGRPANARVDGDIVTVPLGDIGANENRSIILETQAEGTDASGGLSLKAVALFDTPAAASQRTAPVENLVLRGEMTYESASYRFSSLFEGQDTEIEPAGRAQLDKIIEE